MAKSFYHFLMNYRHSKPKDKISQFANDAFLDLDFPKHSKNYHDLSTYLEFNGGYLDSMVVFDQAWELYVTNEKREL